MKEKKENKEVKKDVEKESVKKVKVFTGPLAKVESFVNTFIICNSEKLDLVNCTINYDDGTGEYIACVVYQLYDISDESKLETPEEYFKWLSEFMGKTYEY